MMLSFKNRQDIFRITAWMIILGGLLLTATAFAVVRNWDRQRLRANFEHAAENRSAAVKREIASDIEVLLSVRAFYLHAKVVTRSEFHTFTESVMSQQTGIQAFVWLPRVPYSQREKYEKAARRDGFKDFQITEPSTQGKMAKAGKRDEYFPVYFVEPYKGNEFILGYDLTSDPLRKEALDRSYDTGGIAATARITLVRDKKEQAGFLVVAPVYQQDMPAAAPQARKDNIRGFALGAFRVGDVVERALTYLDPEGIDVYLYDNSAQGKERFLYFHPARTGQTTDLLRNEKAVPDGSLKIARTLKVADREWQVLCVATPAYVARGMTWQPWGVLLAGLLLSGLLSGFLPVVARRAEKIANSNKLLQQEITVRKSVEEALQKSENRYRELSIVDGLTQLYNSRHFYFQLKIELDRSNRYGQPLTLLLLDLDNFKHFNDAYGHVAGDQVLMRLGQVVKRCLRETDFAYRYGGEEFTILLPMTTSADGAVTAERIRTEFKKETFSPAPGQDVHKTVSIGLAQYRTAEEMKAFVHRVDQLMYQAKKEGRDRFCSES
ncbi:MAG: CHASE domain-containing protein [Syntrophales bacterium]|nr:CHASE domain-containing protein [Syntrophales bacterium]